MKKIVQYFVRLLLCIVCLTSFCHVSYAAELPVPGQDGSAAVHFYDGDSGIPEAWFHLYYVAGIGAHGVYSLTDSFRGCGMELSGTTNASWKAAARSIGTWIREKGLGPDMSGETDQNGRLTFSGLRTGLYFIRGEMTVHREYTYAPEDCLIVIPGEASQPAVYSVSVEPKFTRTLTSEPRAAATPAVTEKMTATYEPVETVVPVITAEEKADEMGKESDAAKTGDNRPLRAAAAAASVAGVCFILGLILISDFPRKASPRS